MGSRKADLFSSSLCQWSAQKLESVDESTEIVECFNFKQVFDLLSLSGADQFALICQKKEEIPSIFDYLKSSFELNQSVSLALIFSSPQNH